ncbi:ABC transporter substrate-binding protein [Gordonia sp. SMJS1]|uniref:ABC transporter substrate-binding protein n=1 Tax=Gordonia sp. SMJS1 TaxID=3039400 RepID=UPI00083B0C43|nr:ABC transporter substrate-binding protein [Gordonia sp. SMJS1]OCW85932.1 ABC transporter substrate-binding protein [Nocardia farcinica]WGJ84011.1 ABC transporter substrate-binding protein [Gordonia sp. SMJS1]
MTRVARWLGVLLAVLVVVTGCVDNEARERAGQVVPIDVDVATVPDIAALVPPEIARTGRLIVGVNIPYQPNEFKDASGKIIGYDVDLMNAVGKVLGLVPDYKESQFDTIIPSVQAGTYQLGMSSFTDTLEREKQVDFVTYYSAGVQWAQASDNDDEIDPDNACGLRVAVQTTTYEDTDEVPAKSAACVAAGKPAIDKVRFDSQDEAVNALILGRVDAMSADSPVTAYAIKRTDDRLKPAGGVFDSAPYGWPVRKGSPLAPALQRAVQYLMDNGQYEEIAANWGLEEGMIDVSVINGAVS